jgi:hypothetical protein
MKKHKANELIQEATLRATSVVSQIQSGKSEANISDFKQNAQYGIFPQTTVLMRNLNQFAIDIDNVDVEVCNQMKSAVGEKTVLRMVECAVSLGEETTASLIFNTDFSTKSYETSYKTREECEENGKVWCSGTATCVERDCCENQIVGPCQKCAETGEVLSALMEGKPCNYQGENDGICYQGSCVYTEDENCLSGESSLCATDSSGARCCPIGQRCGLFANGEFCASFDPSEGCATNADCESLDVCPDGNCFCNLSGQNDAGECQSLTGDYAPSNPVNIVGLGMVVHANAAMYSYGAKNWCEALGKTMVNSSDIGCYKSGTTEPLNETGFCCAKGKTCDDWSTNGMWQERSQQTAFSNFSFIKTAWAGPSDSIWKDVPYDLTEEGLVLAQNYSPTIVDLRQKFGMDPSNQYNSFGLNSIELDINKGQLWGNPTSAYPLCR